jgi:hypothetical protein
MVSFVNTLDCWYFKEKKWIFLLFVSCALVYWLKTCSIRLGFWSSSLWTIIIIVYQALSFGVWFLQPVMVLSCCHSFFISVVVMFRSYELRWRLLRVSLFFICFG